MKRVFAGIETAFNGSEQSLAGSNLVGMMKIRIADIFMAAFTGGGAGIIFSSQVGLFSICIQAVGKSEGECYNRCYNNKQSPVSSQTGQFVCNLFLFKKVQE